MSKQARELSHSKPLTRRAFLGRTGITLSALVASSLSASYAASVYAAEAANDESEGSPFADSPAVLVDLTRCVGCNSCALACKVKNDRPDPDVAPEGLSNEAFTFVSQTEISDASGNPVTKFAKRQCMHCLEPACVAACPAAAMYKSEEGPIVYRPNRCLGCRYCQVACPFEVPAFDWNNGLTPKISKCWFCLDRQLAGEQPACVEACPTGALHFGRRSELLAQAHARIATNPDRYVDHVFGEFEVGGTSWLYISDVPFEELGFPAGLPEEAPPHQSEKVMKALPAVILGMSALATGTAVYTHRSAAKTETSAMAEASELTEANTVATGVPESGLEQSPDLAKGEGEE